MSNKEVENATPDLVGKDTQPTTETGKYHAPTFVHYGALAELVRINPSTGPDGGTADCQHN